MGRYLEQLRKQVKPAGSSRTALSPLEIASYPASPVALLSVDRLITTDKTAKTPKTPDNESFVSIGSASTPQPEDFSPRTCGTCRHALREPSSISAWRWCGLGWVGGLADQQHCDDWHDAGSTSRHDPRVDRAKALIASGWSPWNAAAKAYGEGKSGGQP